MARLAVLKIDNINPAQLAAGSPAAPEWLIAGSNWQLTGSVDLYSQARGEGLASQAWPGRHLQIVTSPAVDEPAKRLRVQLLDDGYPGWLEPDALLGRAVACSPPQPQLLQRCSIARRLEQVLCFAQAAQRVTNTYLWGGSLGPNYDCSGLVQRAYASAGIWIPRDAYLQERFCQAVAVLPGQVQLLEPGDLIFFGRPQRCSHVGLHLGGGRYLHSSGVTHGRNGIGIDDLAPHNPDPVALHYLLELRGAGRVMHSHNGRPLPF
ncbi:MAG: C40 family peptidase [Cyanobacteria bacterium]|nr:C40 family peptidase [Cyanobacteriota bacterium]MDA1247265.1 C40 family peptidase [Cyanobacteriota bacterium]